MFSIAECLVYWRRSRIAGKGYTEEETVREDVGKREGGKREKGRWWKRIERKKERVSVEEYERERELSLATMGKGIMIH